MKIKRLEVVGFKSFVLPTVIDFDAPIVGIVGPNGCGKCVHGDTQIPLSDGRRVPIRHLVESAIEEADSVESMDDGQYTYDNPHNLQVLTLDPKTLKMTTRPVLAFVRRSSPQVLLKVTTRSGRTITATEYHPFFVNDQGNLRAIRADELSEGISIAAPRFLPVAPSLTHFAAVSSMGAGDTELEMIDGMQLSERVRTRPLCTVTKLTSEWGRFLGYIISEGQNSAWTNQVRFTNSDPSVLEDYANTVKTLFGREPVRRRYKKNTDDYFLFSSILCNLLEITFGIRRGGHSSTKKIPSIIFQAPNSVAWEFLSALFEGDGCVRVDSSRSPKRSLYVEYATASSELAKDVATLLLRMGIRGLIREKKKKATGSSGPLKTYYSVYIYGLDDLKRLAKNLRLVSNKGKKLAQVFDRGNPSIALDTIPATSAMFNNLWMKSEASIPRKHPLRGRMEVYRQGRCNPSREGLKEAVHYVRENANSWDKSLEKEASLLERLSSSDIYWDDIVSIEKIDGCDWVYDLCVEETHNFVANDLVVHNSNVVDAIRWVLGEMSPKSLRGRAMEDVIFNGTENRPPHGMAEVSLTFSTEDGIAPAAYAGFTEITVTRRLFRSGESEYLINKVPARLRDIIDLFLGTGVGHKAYSIIEQGKVDFAINAKPEDRRLLLEEAAGVSKFKARKESALRKIESTEQNLARLKDILSEVARQINSLDRQVRKAERYKSLKGEMRDLELKLASLTHQEWTREVSELKSLLNDWNQRESSSTADLALVETERERGRLELMEKDRQHNALQERAFEASSRLKLLEAQEGFQQKEIIDLKSLHERSLRETEELESRLASLRTELAHREEEKSAIAREAESSRLLLDETEKTWQEIENFRIHVGENLNILKEEIHRISSDSTRLEGEKRLLDDRKSNLQNRITSLETERKEAQDLHEAQSRVVQEKKSLRDQAEAKSHFLRVQLENLKRQLSSEKERHEAMTQEINLRREDLVFKRSRLKSLLDLEKNFEGYDEGVRSILKSRKESGQHEGAFGVLAEFIETAPQYELAVSAALGDKLQYIIVQSHETGIEAIRYLRSQSAGRGSFIPLGIRDGKADSVLPSQPGVIGPLYPLVKVREGYENIARYLLEDVILVDSLEVALSLRNKNHRHTMVTLEGDILDASGIMSGGTGALGSQMFLEKKREIKELQTIVGEMEQEIGMTEDAIAQLEGKISEMSAAAEETSKQSHQAELHGTTLQNETRHTSAELDRLGRELQKLENNLRELSEETGKSDPFFVHYESQINLFSQTRIEKSDLIARQEVELLETGQRAKDLQERLTTLRIQAAAASERRSMIEREVDRLIKTDGELRQGIEEEQKTMTEANGRHQDILKSLETASHEKAALKKLTEELALQQEISRKAYDEISTTLQTQEEKIRELRKENDLARSHTGDLRVTLSKLETEIHHLEQQIFEKYSINLPENVATFGVLPSDMEFNREEEEKKLTELREKLDRLGDVNLGALPEYEELKGRQEFLGKQIEDLEFSLDALKKAIQRINQTTKKRFEETLTLVNERFQTLFPRLFQGGRAELRLTNEHDLLNAGVDLMVQPRGKRLSHISLLSGGEKAMSAVAFIFSIFLVKPSPFCILDEVDAPLDEVNTDRFHTLISEMAPRTQFILITHNRRTMEKTDLLYGVTMQEPGISQLVSVRFSDQLKMAS